LLHPSYRVDGKFLPSTSLLRRVGVLGRGCAMTKADYGWLILGIILLFLLFVVWAPH
jgi:hypothetical protein